MTARTLTELADLCHARVVGDGTLVVTGPASLDEASAGEISFLTNPRYAEKLHSTRAAAVVVAQGVGTERADLTLLQCEDPGRAFSRIIEAFAAEPWPQPRGVHPTAVIEAGAELDPSACLGPHVVVGAGARIAAGVVLHAGVVLGAGVSIGTGSTLHPGVIVYPGVTLGERVTVHGGSVLGADGFGFEPDEHGWEKIPQLGTVEIADDVDIGANVTIDRGRFGATRIGRSVKIDNLVHVAHNVQVGAGALLVAQSGVAGSTRIGERVILAGQAGVSGHLTVGAGARIGGGSAVFKDVPPGMDYFGMPAGPKAESLRVAAESRRLGALRARLRDLTARLQRLEGDRS
jgi:UDP-3-O-[3-hydroxymyristoyl] glucosamine N-acyltransferase